MSSNSLFGFLALVVYATTLIPSNIISVFYHTKKWKVSKLLLNNRRLLGLMAFSLSISHALISIMEHNIDFFDIRTYSTYYTGVSVFAIFTILALTSNNWSIKMLREKWKLLHQLTYLATFLLLWHVLSLMKDSWTFLTPIALHIISFVSLLYISRLIIINIRVLQDKLNYLNRGIKLQPDKLTNKNVIRETIEVSSTVKHEL